MKTSSKRIMKSLLALTLSTALVAPSYVTAATTAIKNTQDAGHTETYVTDLDGYSLSVYANITGTEVISADISWGSLVYTYSKSGWDPATLTASGSAEWKPAEKDVSDVITVDNRSNVKLTANFSYTKGGVVGFENVEGSFTNGSLTLETAYQNPSVTEIQRKKSTQLSLTGAPEESVQQNTLYEIGSVIVTLAKAE